MNRLRTHVTFENGQLDFLPKSRYCLHLSAQKITCTLDREGKNEKGFQFSSVFKNLFQTYEIREDDKNAMRNG